MGCIWGCSKTNIDQADVLLLGPQVRYMLSSMKTLADEKNVGIDVINPMHYGMMNGEAVLDHALTLKNNWGSKMQKFIAFMEKYIVPVAGKIGSQRHLAAIRDGFIAVMPLILVGALASLINGFPSEAFKIS